MKRILFIAIAFLFCGLSTAEAQTRSDGFCKVTVVNPSGPIGCCYSSGDLLGTFVWDDGYQSPFAYGAYTPNNKVVDLSVEARDGNVVFMEIAIHPHYNRVTGTDGNNTFQYDPPVDRATVWPKSCCKPLGPIQPPGPPSTY